MALEAICRRNLDLIGRQVLGVGYKQQPPAGGLPARDSSGPGLFEQQPSPNVAAEPWIG
jgi:hypothetical protein